jgi:putative two-component system response regulator
MSSAQTERLEELLETNSAADRAEVKAILIRLLSEIKERRKRGSAQSLDFFNGALRALSHMKGPAYAEIRMECLFYSTDYFYHEGLQARALECANDLRKLASLSGDLVWIRKAHTAAGVANADMGNPGEALVHYARALELSTDIGDQNAQVRVLINSGVALNYAGLYREAIPCLHRASQLARVESRDLHSKALINLAQTHLYLGEFREGLNFAERAIAETPTPANAADAISYVIKAFTSVQLALELGRLSAAREYAKICADFAQWSDAPRGKALATMAEGLCEVHGGSVNRGLAMLEESLVRTSPTDAYRTQALVSLVQAHDVAGNPERALLHMRSLLEHIRCLREKGLVALLAIKPDSAMTRPDLQALELRQAQLEARVAERETDWQRIEMLERLAVTADLKEEASGEHGYRVGKLASLVAESLVWSRDDSYSLDLASRLHDIGKIAVPDRILLSSKVLQEAERHFMSTHTAIGAELLAKSNIPQLRMAEEIARHHHEWWNGEGYPSKLKGKRIPIHARIVALADVFDALTHGRPFAEPWPMDKAIEEIRSKRGTQFDPELTDVFLDLVERLRNEHQDLDEYLGRAGRNSPFLVARNKIRSMLAEERGHEKKSTVEGNQTRH